MASCQQNNAMTFLNKFSKQSISISLEVIEFIEKESALSTVAETGGVIGGTGKVEDGNVVIVKASGAGPKAIKRHSYFSRDTKYAQSVIDAWASSSNGEIDYLGEWHKHLEVEPHPSFTDIETMRSIAMQSNYHISQSILIIIGESNNRKTLRLFVINANGEIALVPWVLQK